jgi:hypothetical protein
MRALGPGRPMTEFEKQMEKEFRESIKKNLKKVLKLLGLLK